MVKIIKSFNYKLSDSDVSRFNEIKEFLEKDLKIEVSDPFVCRYLINNFEIPKNIEVSA